MIAQSASATKEKICPFFRKIYAKFLRMETQAACITGGPGTAPTYPKRIGKTTCE